VRGVHGPDSLTEGAAGRAAPSGGAAGSLRAARGSLACTPAKIALPEWCDLDLERRIMCKGSLASTAAPRFDVIR